MVRIFTGIGLIGLAIAIALVTGGTSGGPEGRRNRIAALGKWPATFVMGLVFGLPLMGFFVIVSSPRLTGFYSGMSDSQILVTDVTLAFLCIGGGLLFSRAMWRLQHTFDEVMAPLKEARLSADLPTSDVRRQETPEEMERGARQLIAERKAALRTGRIVGVCAAVVIAGFGLLVMLGSGGNNARASAFGLFAAGYFNYSVIFSWFCARPRVVLLLRRFGSFDDRRFRVADVLSDVCRGLAIPMTVQDESFKGAMPIGLEALDRYVCIPIAFFGPLFLMIAVPSPFIAFGAFMAMVIYFGLVAAIYILLRSLVSRRVVLRPGRSNYRKVLTGFLHRLRGRASVYSGTRVIKLTNDSWREAIELCLKEVDCVVIDITDLNDSVAWEVNMAYQHLPAEAILLTWELDASSAESPTNSIWAIPAVLSSKLAAIVPGTAVERSRRYPRPAERDLLSSVLYELAWPVEIARCLAAARSRQGPA